LCLLNQILLYLQTGIYFWTSLTICFGVIDGLTFKFAIVNHHVSVVLIFYVAQTVGRINWSANFDWVINDERGLLIIFVVVSVIFLESPSFENDIINVAVFNIKIFFIFYNKYELLFWHYRTKVHKNCVDNKIRIFNTIIWLRRCRWSHWSQSTDVDINRSLILSRTSHQHLQVYNHKKNDK